MIYVHFISVINTDVDKNYYQNLPKGWAVCRLTNIGYITGGGTPKTDVSKYWGGEINWLTPAEMSSFKSMFFESTKKRITVKGLASSSAKIIKPLSVIMSSRAPIGYLAINLKNCTTSQGCKSITRYSDDLFDLNYLYFLIKSKVKQYNSESSGTTFKEISGNEFGNTIVSIPPLFEQRRICKLLESIISTLVF